MNITIDLLGKPYPKQRPRMVRGKIWTPSNKHEDALAMQMLKWKGAFEGNHQLGFLCWFYGADVRADGDNLWKLAADAAVKAGVIDDDRYIVHGSFTICHKDDAGNPFPETPSTRIVTGDWK